MLKKIMQDKAIPAVLLVSLLVFPAQAYAWSWGHRNRQPSHHHYPQHARSVSRIPGVSVSLSLGGLYFYYSDGVFYRRSGHNYVVVTPPCGAVVSSIPPGYQKIVIGRVTYYTNEGIYYQHTPGGYIVVEPPVVVNNTETIIVNVPNSRGGYTAVCLRRSGRGFIGPQGEYYMSLPSAEQLHLRYGY